jgi:hypothetical protein
MDVPTNQHIAQVKPRLLTVKIVANGVAIGQQAAFTA